MNMGYIAELSKTRVRSISIRCNADLFDNLASKIGLSLIFCFYIIVGIK